MEVQSRRGLVSRRYHARRSPCPPHAGAACLLGFSSLSLTAAAYERSKLCTCQGVAKRVERTGGLDGGGAC